MRKLGIICDEISDDFEKACFVCKKNNLKYIELRTINNINLIEINENEHKYIQKLLKKYNISVSAIASPVFKSNRQGKKLNEFGDYKINNYFTFQEQIKLFIKATSIAKFYDTSIIRVFTFLDENNLPDIIDDIADKIIELTNYTKNIKIAIENESSCNIKNGLQANYLLSMIKYKSNNLIKNIGLLWDPGNAYHSTNEKPYPDANNIINTKDIIHIHLKDIYKYKNNFNFVPVGLGEINYLDHIKKLKKDGYKGLYVLEPHYYEKGTNKEISSEKCINHAQQLFNKI